MHWNCFILQVRAPYIVKTRDGLLTMHFKIHLDSGHRTTNQWSSPQLLVVLPEYLSSVWIPAAPRQCLCHAVSVIYVSPHLCSALLVSFLRTPIEQSENWRSNMNRSMTKPTKWPVCPAKTQISLGICPVWSVFAVCMKKAWVFSYSKSAQRRLIGLGECPGWSESSLGA